MKTVYDWRPQIDEIATRQKKSLPDVSDADFWEIYDVAKRYSMLHATGFFNLYSAIKYVSSRKIAGNFVECGTFLGGASIFAALAKKHFGLSGMKIFMYDTFAGFPADSHDIKDGVAVKGPSYKSFRAAVEDNIREAGVEMNDIVMIEGPVEDTLISGPIPDSISILRLDTDFYSSTKIEMQVLYPRLAQGGVLIVDDYGSYEGSRRAVDESLSQSPLFLARVDKSVRCGIKA